MSLINSVDYFNIIRVNLPTVISKCKWKGLMLHNHIICSIQFRNMMRNVDKYGISKTKIQSKFQQLYLIFEIMPMNTLRISLI